MSEAVVQHRAAAPQSLNLAVITVSDTRTMETDTSGALIVTMAEEAGHRILRRGAHSRRAWRDEAPAGGARQRADLHAILVTGGTGISPRDQTYETVSALLTKPMPGYGELFRMLSFAEIGPACVLSRAVGGLIHKTVVLVMPGSRAGVELAMRKIILPELPHIVRRGAQDLT